MRDPKINKEKLTEKKVKIISFSTNKNLSPQKIIINYFQAINNNIEMSEKKKIN